MAQFAPKNLSAQQEFSSRSGVAAALAYTAPVLRELPCGRYIEFYAYDPERGRLRRKTIKVNRIKNVAALRRYARDVIKRLTEQLNHGWNPWIARDCSELYTMEEVLVRYENHIKKMLESGYYPKETYAGYRSYLKMMRLYMERHRPTYYVYQFDRRFCTDFLDYIFIDKDNCAQTRNNYLNFLRVFSGFLVEKGYLNSRPTDGIAPINRRLYAKQREVIPAKVVGEIAEYCRENDPHFLLACYLLYYCFIRPVEMTRLHISDFNVKECTVTINCESSKNRTTQTVTMPKKVLLYAVDLGVFDASGDDFLFSVNLHPGREQIDTKLFRDRWAKVSRALNLKREWKFYSLKDTGITEMCDNNVAAITVRDQARHSSLAVTDIYTRRSAKAKPEIIELDGAL